MIDLKIILHPYNEKKQYWTVNHKLLNTAEQDHVFITSRTFCTKKRNREDEKKKKTITNYQIKPESCRENQLFLIRCGNILLQIFR